MFEFYPAMASEVFVSAVAVCWISTFCPIYLFHSNQNHLPFSEDERALLRKYRISHRGWSKERHWALSSRLPSHPGMIFLFKLSRCAKWESAGSHKASISESELQRWLLTFGFSRHGLDNDALAACRNGRRLGDSLKDEPKSARRSRIKSLMTGKIVAFLPRWPLQLDDRLRAGREVRAIIYSSFPDTISVIGVGLCHRGSWHVITLLLAWRRRHHSFKERSGPCARPMGCT